MKHKKQVNGFKKHIEDSLQTAIKKDKRINFIVPQLMASTNTVDINED